MEDLKHYLACVLFTLIKAVTGGFSGQLLSLPVQESPSEMIRLDSSELLQESAALPTPPSGLQRTFFVL